MRSLIVDDEAAARSRLRRLLAGHSEIEVIGEARDGLEALAQIERLQPDLLFLDIEMPGLSGFDVLRSISSSAALPLVIFVTGYDQHALAAFDANALAYLLKPVEADRLAHAVDRARRLDAVAGDKETERQRISRAVDNAPRVFRQIVGRKRDGLVLMAPENILWFEVREGLVRARTETDSFWVNHQLVELEAGLPEGLFFRARREVLVNLTHIKQIKPYFKSGFLLIMADAAKTEIAVSERQVRPLRQRLPGL
jgi:two-component system LytT family response regulator